MQKILLLCLFFGSFLLPGCSHKGTKTMITDGEFERNFSTTISKTIGYRYHLYIPNIDRPEKGFPLLLFLHGAGERGSDIELVKIHGLNNMLETLNPMPCIVISPQVPDGAWWDSEILDALIDHILETYPIDSNRIYVTGLSMGGYGTWDVITKYPERFAAAIPICGGGNWLLADKARNVPVWAFHGDADTVIPIDRSVEMVEALRQAGGDAQLTVYPDTGHDAWTPTYRNEEIYQWLLQHQRKSD